MSSLREQHVDSVRAEVAQGVVDGLQAILEDDRLMKKFWLRGYEELSSHSSVGASQWVGKRAFGFAVAAIAVWSIGWLIRNGGLK